MQRSRYEARCSAATVGRCEKTCEAINAVVGLKGPEARLTVTSVLIVHQNRGPVSGSHIFAMLPSWMLVAGFAWVNITSFLYSC